MKRFYVTAALVLVLSCLVYTAEEKIRLALSPFDDSLTLASENIRAGSAVTSVLEQKYSDIDRFQVRERGTIKDYLQSIARVQLGMADPDSLKTSSDELKIDYLTVGTVSRFGDRYEIDARTVNINNWNIVHSRGCSMYNISNAVDEIDWYISNQFTMSYLKQRESTDIDKPGISVFRFKDDNEAAAKTGYSGAFAEILNSELGSYTLITTVERTYTRALVNEKMLEMAGVIENDGSDKNFSLKGIDYKLTGEIRIFDDLICITYFVHDTADGRVVHIGTREIASLQGIRPAARDIALTIEDLLNNRIGTLKIQSEPPEAEVLVNGEVLGKTPLVTVMARGKNELLVRAPGCETYKETLDIKAKEVVIRDINLLPLQQAYKHEARGRWEEAIALYDKFIELYGDTTESHNALYRKGHVLLINLKQYEEALKTFTALVEQYPETMVRAEAYYGLARTHYLLGNKKEAKKNLDYLLEKYGDTFAAQEAHKIRERF